DPAWGRFLLAAVAAAVVVLSYRWIAATAGRTRGAITALLVGWSLMTWQVANHLLFHEAWAAYFLILSMCLHAMDRWRLAVAAALVGLAFRELALLPCGVGLLLALRRGRRPEV